MFEDASRSPGPTARPEYRSADDAAHPQTGRVPHRDWVADRLEAQYLMAGAT